MNILTFLYLSNSTQNDLLDYDIYPEVRSDDLVSLQVELTDLAKREDYRVIFNVVDSLTSVRQFEDVIESTLYEIIVRSRNQLTALSFSDYLMAKYYACGYVITGTDNLKALASDRYRSSVSRIAFLVNLIIVSSDDTAPYISQIITLINRTKDYRCCIRLFNSINQHDSLKSLFTPRMHILKDTCLRRHPVLAVESIISLDSEN